MPEDCGEEVAAFLQHTPLLERLTLWGQRRNKDDTAFTLNHVAHQVHLPRLMYFRLHAIRCDLADLVVFLRKHETVRILELSNITATGSLTCATAVRQIDGTLPLDNFTRQ